MTQKRTARPGEKLVYGFAATGLTLAVAIGAWTWNSAVPETKHATTQTSSPAQVSDAVSTSPTRPAESSEKEPRPGTPARSAARGGAKKREQPSESLNTLEQEHNLALAPLGENDPFLPPDTWRGEKESSEPSQTVVEQAPEKASPNRKYPQLPKLPDNFPARPKAPWNDWIEDWMPKRPGGNNPGGNNSGGQGGGNSSSPDSAPPSQSGKPSTVPGGEVTGETTHTTGGSEKEDPEPEGDESDSSAQPEAPQDKAAEKDVPADPTPRQ